MISEAKMVHKLWNIMEERGYQVGGEVNIVPEEIHRTLREWTVTPDSRGNTVPKKKKASTRIDLVATDGKSFIGFEVKDGFDKVVHSLEQLVHYTKGGMLDEVYLVIPLHECEHVKSSYGGYLKEIGVGLATLNGNDLSIVSPSSMFHRSMLPDLKQNEAWLRELLWNHFEGEFEGEGEGILPKPINVLKNLQFSMAPSPNRFLQKIDLFLLPKGRSITEVAYSQDKLECIGIEIKYEIKNEKTLEKIIEQLNSYADSGVLTRLYLATAKRNDLWLVEKIKTVGNRKFGLLVCDGREVKTILEPPKLQIQYDMFAYMPPTGGRVTVYEFGKAKSTKTFDFYNYADSKGREEFFRGKLEFYRLIYAGLSKRKVSHVIEVI